MEKRSEPQAKWNKESLFQDFFETAEKVLPEFEMAFDVTGVCEQFLGDSTDENVRKAKVRNSPTWALLSDLFDYANDGQEPYGGADYLVIDGSRIIKFLQSENHWISNEWAQVVTKGDARYGLDDGSRLDLEQLSLLANVDPRTVRNAISAGDLESEKVDQRITIDNASARKWLTGRRSFKLTVTASQGIQEINTIDTPPKFGAFLKKKRQQLNSENVDSTLTVFHPSVNAQVLTDLEGGAFNLPLDTVFPIADFYQINRKAFLACVMRVFFREQMQMLSETMNAETQSNRAADTKGND